MKIFSRLLFAVMFFASLAVFPCFGAEEILGSYTGIKAGGSEKAEVLIKKEVKDPEHKGEIKFWFELSGSGDPPIFYLTPEEYKKIFESSEPVEMSLKYTYRHAFRVSSKVNGNQKIVKVVFDGEGFNGYPSYERGICEIVLENGKLTSIKSLNRSADLNMMGAIECKVTKKIIQNITKAS